MAATLTPTSFNQLLQKLKNDYPQIKFSSGETFYWSPKDKTVFYKHKTEQLQDLWSLIHELSHALLSHESYESDVELLMLEVAAWNKAEQLSKTYGIKMNKDHVQDCLDTYRDWLFRRSTCPNCEMRGLQVTSTEYNCTNCYAKWSVSMARFCRPYRRRKVLAK